MNSKCCLNDYSRNSIHVVGDRLSLRLCASVVHGIVGGGDYFNTESQRPQRHCRFLFEIAVKFRPQVLTKRTRTEFDEPARRGRNLARYITVQPETLRRLRRKSEHFIHPLTR